MAASAASCHFATELAIGRSDKNPLPKEHEQNEQPAYRCRRDVGPECMNTAGRDTKRISSTAAAGPA
ncbi:hypothetical protein GGTG_10716 [Gaeumannomyces tritici R3-111a-1]|uniref:Uncharacterized protein n=1 Tax=Gaeumannomyces tritici (strain R3-111a-1) TaxID=644352 RepID=J3PB43_GAET3|nr:hypothetical protein GGTG_10716 [Gaeumannomyces tritici R3-111a-1]EJT71459.1 hypothetical protein GGTG_10716 [Gaeumannomyces tritici R3-111a-1]